MNRSDQSKPVAAPPATVSLTGAATRDAAPLRTTAAPRPRSEGPSSIDTDSGSTAQEARFIDTLVGFTRQLRASHWSGTFAQFLEAIVHADPAQATRRSRG